VKFSELRDKTVLILGLGVEGRSTWRFLRRLFPYKQLGLADRLRLEQMPLAVQQEIESDACLQLHLGDMYLASLAQYDVIIKSPGISIKVPEYQRAVAAGKQITSQTALFFANAEGTIIGITGTKGKSTTSALIYTILKRVFPRTQLVGNIGVPPLDLLGNVEQGTGTSENQKSPIYVYELSSHQLEGLRQSPHIAVLLNIVPEHLDYYESFEQYVAAKENITRFQAEMDFLVYDSDHDLPRRIAARSKARGIACSLESEPAPGCFVHGESLVYRPETGAEERLLSTREVPLLGRFNLINVAAAAAAAKLGGAPAHAIAEGVRNFRPLEHRLEYAGEYGGVKYYNDSIATVPEATIAALDTLGDGVQTILLGGTDRGLDFRLLAARLLHGDVKTVILFPPSGERIWSAVEQQNAASGALPRHFFVGSMEEAVVLAKEHTAKGKICLLSPSSPSFGLFRDYRERGAAFKRLVREP